MKIIVERDAFAEAVGMVKHATDKSLKIPILANALIRANGAGLEIAATNLDCRSECTVAAEIGERSGDSAITVPVGLLSDLAARFPKGSQVSLEWPADGRQVTMSAGRARYKLHALPASDFPALPPPVDAVTFSMSGKVLAHAINTVRWATYDQVDRPNVCGVFLHVTDNDHPALGSSRKKHLAFVGTDHKQLARFTTDVPEGLKELPHLILPNAALGEIARLANEAEDKVTLAVSSTKFSITNGSAVFLTKIINAVFPDRYPSIIPEREDARMLVDCDVLRNALLRLKALGDDSRTRAEWSSGLLTLTLTNSDRGHAEERIEIAYDAEPLALPVSATAWLAVIDHMEADVCLFRIERPTDRNRAIIINPMRGTEIDYSRTFLSMPMER